MVIPDMFEKINKSNDNCEILLAFTWIYQNPFDFMPA